MVTKNRLNARTWNFFQRTNCCDEGSGFPYLDGLFALFFVAFSFTSEKLVETPSHPSVDREKKCGRVCECVSVCVCRRGGVEWGRL